MLEKLESSEELVRRRPMLSVADFELLRQSREFLLENFDEAPKLSQLADSFGYSPWHFQRRFKQAFGETPQEVITRARMEAAAQLLRSSELTVSDVCVEVGYSSLGSFSESFARRYGCPPSEFRRVFAFPGLWELKCVPSCFRSFTLRTAR